MLATLAAELKHLRGVCAALLHWLPQPSPLSPNPGGSAGAFSAPVKSALTAALAVAVRIALRRLSAGCAALHAEIALPFADGMLDPGVLSPP